MAWEKKKRKNNPVDVRKIHVRTPKPTADHRKIGQKMIKKIRRDMGWQ